MTDNSAGMTIRSGVRAGNSPRCKQMQNDLKDTQNRIDDINADYDLLVDKFSEAGLQQRLDKLNAYQAMIETFLMRECADARASGA
jgi:hypothetical protein